MQVALNLALSILKETHTACSREIVIITGSISTRDPGNIYSTLEDLRQNAVRTSVISFAPEMHVLKLATKLTGGTYHTVMNERIFEDVLKTFIVPPTFTVTSQSPTAIQLLVGFPREVASPTICECHRRIEQGHFECPMCGFCYCDLPVQCKVCGATLLFSHHFARSFHFLFPLKPFLIKPRPRRVDTPRRRGEPRRVLCLRDGAHGRRDEGGRENARLCVRALREAVLCRLQRVHP